MKRLALLTFLSVTILVAQDSCNLAVKDELKKIEKSPYDRKEGVYNRYPLTSNVLPNLIGPYVKFGGQHKINATDEQEIVFEELFEEMLNIRSKVLPQIQALESLLVKKVVDEGASLKQVQGILDEIASKKMALTVSKIKCIHILKKTWTKSQYQQILDIEKKLAKENP